VECKNYGSELANPEVDQLAMRFAPARGQVGMLCHRGYGDRARIIQRCRDAATDKHGYIVALDDEDLAALVAEREATTDRLAFTRLVDRFQELL
jgi:hypothetical protein